MIKNLNVWDISINKDIVNENLEKKYIESYFNFNIPCSYLLDKNGKNLSIIEKMVYDIANFHFKRLNIKISDDNYFVEFWIKYKSDINNLHIDCDEYDEISNDSQNLKTPLLSCITYLSDSNIPTIITNISKDDLTQNLFTDEHSFCLSFPKYLKHISFDGGKYYHGPYNIFNDSIDNRYLLTINLWEKKPENVPYFNNKEWEFRIFSNSSEKIFRIDNTKDEKLLTIKNKDDSKEILIEKNREVCTNFYNNLLKQEYICYIKKRLLDNDYKSNDTFTFNRNDNDKKSRNINMFDINSNKFIQRIVIRKNYQKDMCGWLINEIDKYKSNEKILENKDIEVEDIKSIFNFVIISINNIIESISKNFCLDNNEYKFDIVKMFIVNINDKNCDNYSLDNESDLTVVLCLKNDEKKYNCGIKYDDKITTILETGDLIINKSNIKYNFINAESCYYLIIKIKILAITILDK